MFYCYFPFHLSLKLTHVLLDRTGNDGGRWMIWCPISLSNLPCALFFPYFWKVILIVKLKYWFWKFNSVPLNPVFIYCWIYSGFCLWQLNGSLYYPLLLYKPFPNSYSHGHCIWSLRYHWFLVTVTGWYCTKRPMHCGHFLIYCTSPSEFYNHFWFIHQSSLAVWHIRLHSFVFGYHKFPFMLESCQIHVTVLYWFIHDLFR
jgi:hypothetical protein